jgi:hypothetical protein
MILPRSAHDRVSPQAPARNSTPANCRLKRKAGCNSSTGAAAVRSPYRQPARAKSGRLSYFTMTQLG